MHLWYMWLSYIYDYFIFEHTWSWSTWPSIVGRTKIKEAATVYMGIVPVEASFILLCTMIQNNIIHTTVAMHLWFFFDMPVHTCSWSTWSACRLRSFIISTLVRWRLGSRTLTPSSLCRITWARGLSSGSLSRHCLISWTMGCCSPICLWSWTM